jgi:hypothetical protein
LLQRKEKRKEKMAVKTFGTQGKEGIEYLGEKPFQWRGEFKLYVWRDWRSQWVDKRDVPALIKEVGIENLGGRNLDAYKEQKAKASRKKKDAADVEVETVEKKESEQAGESPAAEEDISEEVTL